MHIAAMEPIIEWASILCRQHEKSLLNLLSAIKTRWDTMLIRIFVCAMTTARLSYCYPATVNGEQRPFYEIAKRNLLIKSGFYCF
ncbi:MAG: hypothetical protein JWP81_763 [Ferruginibacter sp.]|nr:hypothetical protein [Ferruginibacter sp.]